MAKMGGVGFFFFFLNILVPIPDPIASATNNKFIWNVFNEIETKTVAVVAFACPFYLLLPWSNKKGWIIKLIFFPDLSIEIESNFNFRHLSCATYYFSLFWREYREQN